MLQVPTPHACIQLLSLPSVCWPQVDRSALQQELASLAHLLPTFSHIGSAWPSRQPPGEPLSAAGMLQANPPPGSFSRFFGEATTLGDPLLLPSRGIHPPAPLPLPSPSPPPLVPSFPGILSSASLRRFPSSLTEAHVPLPFLLILGLLIPLFPQRSYLWGPSPSPFGRLSKN